MRWLSWLTALLFVVGACAGSEPDLLHGTVIDKEYDDPDEWTTTECAAYDEDGWCLMYYTAYHHDGAHYRLQVEGVPEGEEDVATRWLSVDAESYYAHDIGDVWVKGSLPCTDLC